MLIPGSGTVEIANWPQNSNVGIDGLFIYRVDESQIWVERSCTLRRIEPFWAQMYYDVTMFKLRGFLCNRANFTSSNNNVPVVFIGKSFNVTITAGITDGEFINGYFPFWGRTEIVEVLPLIDGIDRSESVKVTFLSPSQLSNTKDSLETSVSYESSGEINMELQWESSFWASNFGISPTTLFVTVFNIQNEGRQENPFKITSETVEVSNSGSAQIPVEFDSGSLFFEIDINDNGNCLIQSEKRSLAHCGKHSFISNIVNLTWIG